MSNLIDLTGQQFGRLTVLSRAESCGKRVRWLCKCSCGKEKVATGYDLRSGNTRSCGCLQFEARYNRKKLNRYDLTRDFGVGYDAKGREFYFDLEDYDKIKGHTWNIDRDGYPRTRIDGVSVGLYSLLIEHDEDTWIDHINGNPKDNRKQNLRVATYAQNGMNKRFMSTNTSGVMGVYLNKKANFWCAQISINDKTIYVGGSKDKAKAIKARLRAEKEYYGEFAPQKYLFEQYGI